MSAVSILHSLGTLALMAVGISTLQRSRLGETAEWRRSLIMGLMFGGTVSLVMIDPVVLSPGSTFDARGGPAMLAGVYGGPVAAMVTAAIGSATRWWIGGAGAPVGIVGFAVYAVLGIAARRYFDRYAVRPTAVRLLGLALIGTACSLPAFLVILDWQTGAAILSQAWWMLLSSNVVGVLVLGTLLEQDRRRRELERDLRQSESRTRTAAEAKTRFLAAMSHEIRTPMNAVVGFIDLLRDSSLDSFQRRCTEQIRDAAQGLLRVIDDVLDFAKIDSGGVTLERQPIDLAALVEGCRELLLPQLDAKGIACTLDVPDTLPAAVEGDPIRLRQVLLNLLGNAVKFTDSGRIAVTVRYTPAVPAASGELIVVIADTGIGMTEDERDRLFSAFAQGDHFGRGGTGLGLVISRMLVRAMDGDLTLESSQGAGTTATVRLPVREVAPPPADTAKPAPQPVGGGSGLRILAAEDVALNAEMLQATLEQSHHVVHLVADGRQAVDAVRDLPFDIVLMDVQMPVMDGLAAARAIRALGGPAAAVPIVALTAYASRDDLKACLDAGMNDFLTKPLERSKLLAILERWGGSGRAAVAAAMPLPPGMPEAALEPGSGGGAGAGGDENVERVGELLARLVDVDRDDRDTVHSMAHSLMAAAGHVGFDALADRSRRLMAAAPRSNAEALGALIEDVTDAGRRSLDSAFQAPSGDRR